MATLQIPAPPAATRAAPFLTPRPQAPVDATALFEAALEARIPAGSSVLDVDASALPPAPPLQRAARPAGRAISAAGDWEADDPRRWRTRLVTAGASAVAVAASAGAIALAL